MDTANYDLDLMSDWQFYLGEFERKKGQVHAYYYSSSKAGGALLDLTDFNKEEFWKTVNLPHDWLTMQAIDDEEDSTGGCKARGTAWYKKTIRLPNETIESARLIFDGVLGQCIIYVNGIIATRNFSGYNRFECEIGDYLLPGEENQIAVYVDARRWEGWWYEGAGIYRAVKIKFREYTHFLEKDCFTRGEFFEDKCCVLADLKIEEITGEEQVIFSFLTDKNVVVFEKKCLAKEALHVSFTIENPILWSPEKPYQYSLNIALLNNGKKIDEINRKIGLKKIKWVSHEGMFLNGEKYTVKGICCHQDHAGLGAAVYPEIEEYRILKLKALGVNAYRCAHHAPSETLLDICDKIGMLVMVENRQFATNDDALKQLDDMVKLARNHASVFLYCLLNEEPWQSTVSGERMARKMHERIRRLDKTISVTAAPNDGILNSDNVLNVVDVVGINYNLNTYEKCHSLRPDKVIIGTENSPTFATRGIYVSDKEKHVYNCSGDEYPNDFSQPLYETMDCVKKLAYVAGCFVWSGFDYRGEPVPLGYPSVASHWGFMDSCGFDKDLAYWLRCWYKEEFFVRLTSSWTFEKDKEILVYAYTNGETAELFLNGKSLGKKEVINCKACWKVSFERGVIEAVAIKDGKRVCDKVETANEPYSIIVNDETPNLKENKIRIINLSVVDEKGNLVPNYNEELSLTQIGGEIIGVGNGNPNADFLDKAMVFPFFNGKAQIIISKETQELIINSKNMRSSVSWRDR